MSKDRQLLLFIQSPNTDLYVNILTHCINNESVQDVYFAIDKGASTTLSEAKEQIRLIRLRFEDLLTSENAGPDDQGDLRNFQSAYKKAYEKVPHLHQVESRLIKVLFAKPDLSTPYIKKLFPTDENLIVDITGCNKKVFADVISSYISSGVKHIRCFELDKEVFDKRLGRMYHNIRKDLPYYEYVDFSEPGTTTINSFNRMRAQGRLIKLLLMIAIVLGILVVVLIENQKNALAQYASILLALVTALGLFNDSFGTLKILQRS
jgi:hypothetical protein